MPPGRRLTVQPQRHAVDARVQRTHDDQSSPEVAELQETVEDGAVHVLDVALADWHRPVADEVLPADD